jgi:N-methylhydantoinase B/oxoprolinase/acetone carboxylase alpha subunit
MRDVRLGYVTPEAAQRDYKVVVRDDGTLDREATLSARAQAVR